MMHSTLGEICDLITDGTHQSPPTGPNGAYRYVTSKNVRPGRLDLNDITYVTAQVHASIYSSCPVKPGDVLFVKDGANTGTAALNTLTEPFSMLSSVALIRPARSRLDPTYLVRWLNSPDGQRAVTQNMSGSAIRRLVLRDIRQIRLPIPSLPEQRRIATILDQADALRSKRVRAITHLRTLVDATFSHMFGNSDDVGHSKSDHAKLGDIAEVVSGITIGRKLNGQRTRLVPYLAVLNVKDRHLNMQTIKHVDATEDEITRYRLRPGDLVVTEGGDPDKLGRGTLWNAELGECIHQNHIFRIRIDPTDMDPVFLCWLVGSQRGKRYFLKSAKQTTGIASINMTQLRDFPLLRPPLEMQRRFRAQVERIDQITEKMKASLAKLEALYASLQHRAFTGQL